MNKRTRLLAALLALLVTVGGMSLTVSAIAFNVGGTLGTGIITAVDNRNLTTDGAVTFSKAVFTDSGSRQQAVYALEFNPTTSNYMPYVYSKYTGTGSNALATAQQAESQFGANVIGGINATFYAMNTGSTYAGYWVHEGRLAQATLGYQNDIITFDSDGQVNIVNSRLNFSLFHNGREITSGGGSGLVHINKKSLATGVDNRFYYWDTECGTKTDSVIEGLEILCKKLDYGQLAIGGTLRGEVLQIREDSFNSAVGADEFVLYVKNDSPLKAAVAASVKVGDFFEIAVSETIEASKQYTERANAAIVAQYPIVKNGVADTAESLSQLGADFMSARAQRSSIGLKADGTVVLITSAGRNITDSSPGLTVYELADIMVQMGCVTAYNLDGGGSTQMVIKENGSFEKVHISNEGANGRNVANCIYIVERQSPDTEVVTALEQLIADNAENTATAVVEAIANAEAVINNTKSMPGDYTRVYMFLQSALSGKAELDAALAAVSGIFFKDYSDTVLRMIWETYEEASAVRADANATSEEITEATRKLRNLLDMKGTASINVSQGKSYTKLGGTHPTANNNYLDTDDKELTDGNIGSLLISAYGPAWVGFHSSYKGGTEDGKPFYDVTIDLGKIENKLSKFVTYSEHDWVSGIEAPTKVVILVSDNGVNFTEAGIAVADISNLCRSVADEANAEKIQRTDVKYTLNLTEGVSGRYVKFHMVGGATKVFMFITELEVYKSDSPITSGMFLTGYNAKILTNHSIIFTPDYAAELTGDNANLNWARAIAAQWNEEKQAYVVIQTAHGNGSNVIKTVPENGFVLGVHGDNGEGVINKAYANTAKVGDILVLHGIDINSKTALAGCYITIQTAEEAISLKPGVALKLEGAFANGLKNLQTVAEVAAMFNGSVTVKDLSGATITGTALVGTGCVIQAGSNSYTVIVKGDINGDGRINSSDYLFAKRAFIGSYTLNAVQLRAGALEGTPVPTSKDYLRIKRHFLNTYDIFAE
ncbi:MAG: hypothetical protein CVU97_02065 [Firmicutes bacterium HGW-Firmicutes-21]|nr:MAG: hypothetical protein CVU97_02065 [Firmicutes bacterium HGW-Firmicutes-21]